MAPPSTATIRLLWLRDEAARSTASSGGKAASLAVLTAAGFPIPSGVVVPTRVVDEFVDRRVVGVVAVDVIARLGSGPLAVRSSAVVEDGSGRSWAGAFDTVLNVAGEGSLSDALVVVAGSIRAVRGSGADESMGGMAILVQPMLTPRLAGVAFTGESGQPTMVTVVEGSADRLVSGEVDGEEWWVHEGLAEPTTTNSTVASPADVEAVAVLAGAVAGRQRCPQDIEWAIDARGLWLLQARPVTAPLGPRSTEPPDAAGELTLVGLAASPGHAAGPARVITSVDQLDQVRPGDVLVASTTSPAWTPVFAILAAVVTDVGSAAAHAAIVAREFGIPAVTATGDATVRLRDGMWLIVDGTAGTVQIH